MRNERSQAHKIIYCIVPFLYNSKIRQRKQVNGCLGKESERGLAIKGAKDNFDDWARGHGYITVYVC